MAAATQDTEPTMQTKTSKIFSQEGLFWVGGVHSGTEELRLYVARQKKKELQLVFWRDVFFEWCHQELI